MRVDTNMLVRPRRGDVPARKRPLESRWKVTAMFTVEQANGTELRCVRVRGNGDVRYFTRELFEQLFEDAAGKKR